MSTPSATYDPYVAPVYTPPVQTVVGAYPYPGPSSGMAQTPASPSITDSYPAPQISPAAPIVQSPTTTAAGSGAYPGPATSIPTVLNTLQATSTKGSVSTPESGATVTPTATARISQPLGTAPPPPATISIWHSWRDDKQAVLEHLIRSFQDQFPDVYFNVSYFPSDELFESFRQAVYFGKGPSVLIGPSDWGPPLYDMDLIVNLRPYTSVEFLSTINSPALENNIYMDALIGLPYTQHGVLLFRNRSIINQSPKTFEDMINLSVRATRGSDIGAYFEIGSFFSLGHLNGLGGDLMNENYKPLFNDQFGINWIDLLVELERLGPTSFNTDSDAELFQEGTIGMIIDGSWNINVFADAIGEELLVIDPWPAYGDGVLSGFVQTDALFLNSNIRDDEQLAALRFMGYLLDKDAQALLAEADFIPSVLDAQPQNGLIGSAMTAFRGGTAYPVVPTPEYLRPYFDALDAAIGDVFERNVAPSVALQAAEQYILDRLDEIRNEP